MDISEDVALDLSMKKVGSVVEKNHFDENICYYNEQSNANYDGLEEFEREKICSHVSFY